MKFYFVDGEIKKYIVSKIETFIDWTLRLVTSELKNWPGYYDKKIYLELFHDNVSHFSDVKKYLIQDETSELEFHVNSALAISFPEVAILLASTRKPAGTGNEIAALGQEQPLKTDLIPVSIMMKWLGA